MEDSFLEVCNKNPHNSDHFWMVWTDMETKDVGKDTVSILQKRYCFYCKVVQLRKEELKV